MVGPRYVIQPKGDQFAINDRHQIFEDLLYPDELGARRMCFHLNLVYEQGRDNL